MKSNTLTDYYQVNNSNNQVTLSITIGNGHNAISKILLNNHVVQGPETDGSFLRGFENKLGTNEELMGRKLQITTLILNNGEENNLTYLIVSLSGGVTPLSHKLEHKSSDMGVVVKFTMNIKFIK